MYIRASVVGAILLSTSVATAADPLSLTFGVYATDKPSEIFASFKPLIVDLESRLKEELARPVRIKLVISKSYEDACNDLVDGKVDFVRFGPASYVHAKERDPKVELLAIEEHSGKRSFIGVIFTSADGSIATLADLKGKSFAFGNQYSTVGRYLVQAELTKAGISATDLSRYEYLDRHDLVATSVLHKKFDAGAAKEDTFAKYEAQGLKKLATFENVSKPWVARAGLDPAILASLRTVLLAVKDPVLLGKVEKGVSSLGSVEDAEYESVRQGMKLSDKFIGAAAPAALGAQASAR